MPFVFALVSCLLGGAQLCAAEEAKMPVTREERFAWNMANISNAPALLDLVVKALRIASEPGLSRDERDQRTMAIFGVREKPKPYSHQGSGYFYSHGELDGDPPSVVSEIHWVRPGVINVTPGKACVRIESVLPLFHREFGLPEQLEPFNPAIEGMFGAPPEPGKWKRRFWTDGPSGYGIGAPIVWGSVGIRFLFLYERPGCAWLIEFTYQQE
ncbi:MAG: hypothetical protein HZA63_02220 [Rhodocyclales bacterium]|nr:hypothetical protein [Rhodocyclales bacterium]